MDLATGGEDFGWPCYEGAGPDPFEVSGQTYGDFPHCQAKYASNATKAPAFAFPHNYTGCDGLLPTGNTVIAGPVYEGDQYPAGYRGQMIFGDVGDIGIPGCGWIARANIKNGALSDYQLFATGWPSGVDLETAPDGNLAFVSLTNHTVSEIRYGPGNHPPAANPSASPDAKPLTVDFQANASDPDGDAVYYDWDFGDGSAHGIGPAPIHTYSSPGTRKVTVTVDDHRGMTSSATVAATAKPAPVKLRIRSLRLKRGAAVLAGKGQVAGSFSSTERVSKVNVSVWRGRANSKRCAWWSARRHALRRGSCKAPHWLHARLHRKGHAYAWSLALHAPLGRGSYTIVVQAIPQSSEFLPSARLHERLRVRGKRR
jgi:hypothetical protein